MTPWKTGNVYRLPFGRVSPESISWEFRSAEERKRRPFDWGAVEDWHFDRALDMAGAAGGHGGAPGGQDLSVREKGGC